MKESIKTQQPNVRRRNRQLQQIIPNHVSPDVPPIRLQIPHQTIQIRSHNLRRQKRHKRRRHEQMQRQRNHLRPPNERNSRESNLICQRGRKPKVVNITQCYILGIRYGQSLLVQIFHECQCRLVLVVGCHTIIVVGMHVRDKFEPRDCRLHDQYRPYYRMIDQIPYNGHDHTQCSIGVHNMQRHTKCTPDPISTQCVFDEVRSHDECLDG
mmetsp:Transcript_829/g.1514  ORF Transcript_829/g.1514 Transcript_829/m.1514 type:complete len:211 (-) Transcript_829:1334-1966(-)